MSVLSDTPNWQDFSHRHIGPETREQQQMLEVLGYATMAEFIAQVVPENIRQQTPSQLPAPLAETDALAALQAKAAKNQVMRSFIGQGYYGTYTPGVILRNILENPAWYTAYTPYQPEISQGRLEALLNFQTMITELSGMDIASASLLDEATAAAEAMTLCQRMGKNKGKVFFIDEHCLPQTIEVVQTRAEPLDIDVRIGNPFKDITDDCFGVLLQYPGVNGEVADFTAVIEQAHEHKTLVAVAADLLSLVLLKSPGEMGADITVGSSQRFGVPMGFGGPHAGFMATREAYKRSLPGRLVGVSKDADGNTALRLALQTREQHIRREKATSNICTAQVLLAVLASMYAVYHGPQGLRAIAQRVHASASALATSLKFLGVEVCNEQFFDTLTLNTGNKTASIHEAAHKAGINLRHINGEQLGISVDETTSAADINALLSLFGGSELDAEAAINNADWAIGEAMRRQGPALQHPIFNRYHSETEMLRYIRSLSDKDIALDRAMIPLGSCTMKLNATSEMIPVTWPEFANIHPHAPAEQTQGYVEMITELEQQLCEITGYAAISLQPNAGSQGEYAGLLAIRGYHRARNEGHRNICLIPSSAHGTNPASAQMCGMKVVVVACDNNGNINVDDLRTKAEAHSSSLAAIMITYPSTHGVFEESVTEVCDIVHQHGGQVYIDGANLNAMVGLCQPGQFGGDVSHLNLHKTFCIPHGGGGPGVGPVAVAAHLAEFLPNHAAHASNEQGVGPVSAAQYGSASILPITWMYIQMMGADGLVRATEAAILNANYIAHKLKTAYPVLYTGASGLVAHECILDLRPLKDITGVTVDDIAKRLIDYGFHAPTMSFPVAGTLMIEPTESEPLQELDRFIDAMLTIRREIDDVQQGTTDYEDSPLHNAPHTALRLLASDWQHGYSREQAAYPVASLKLNKYWPPVARVDNVYGDKNLVCACLPISEYE
ncbi:aminomethyl-transferring glycine dehydrogenase [Halioxenophilus aromaticivorans]|uniref:Glycine dehydrogenase (decarboxylating) n=1 Tax=Halioxenophilus aromaticivorans TaxID=1306992 RepID=A0AAV3U1M8_9ALTE